MKKWIYTGLLFYTDKKYQVKAQSENIVILIIIGSIIVSIIFACLLCCIL